MRGDVPRDAQGPSQGQAGEEDISIAGADRPPHGLDRFHSATTLPRVSLDNESQQGESPTRPVLWAIFLGVSWTWVIGMFLPVLLVRDYGLLGWVVFAIPNVIGAA